MRLSSKFVDWVTTPYTVYLILKDSTISWSVKLRSVVVLFLVFAYIVIPLDIIPDFIPLSGWLDDLVVIPLGLTLVRIITPDISVFEKRAAVQKSVRRILIWTILSFMVVILLGLLWLSLLIYTIVRLIIA